MLASADSSNSVARPATSRRGFLRTATAWGSGGLLAAAGCIPRDAGVGRLEAIWGKPGVQDGQLQKPRAIAIDEQDQLYIVDMTGRIQVFSRTGQFLRKWTPPAVANGKSSGLTFDNHGHLMVADTHYFRVLFYTRQGQLLADKTIGGTNGYGPGEFNFVTDAVQDSQGNFYVGEYGEHDRIQKFSPAGKFLFQWGELGSEPGQFIRPQNLAIDNQDRIWVADACNHRVQVFDATGDEARLLQLWGEQGRDVGQLDYPYDLVLDGRGHVYICEFGNHRVQKFRTDGTPVGHWGVRGRREGQLYRPWAMAMDSRGALHVLDSKNHRVQRIRL